jgi:hypothetical protein
MASVTECHYVGNICRTIEVSKGKKKYVWNKDYLLIKRVEHRKRAKGKSKLKNSRMTEKDSLHHLNRYLKDRLLFSSF